MIREFRKEYAFLSNFYPCYFEMSGTAFHSAEHAYQWHKLALPADRAKILGAHTPAIARTIGASRLMLEGWDELKTGVMFSVVLAKFQGNKELRERLLETRPHELVEGNYWHDTYWGMVIEHALEGDHWVGENHLGRILMIVRDHFC